MRLSKLSLRSPRLTSLKQQWAKPAPVEPEDSLLLRLFVQGLVTVGIIATDIAAADVVDAIGTSLWAVPVSFVGAGWSYVRRRQRNIPVKFCIAIGMILALAVFFIQLWTERHDTRLALAGLLIHLQVLHSFDLPRRKDLGYSVVIGLILLSVAATLSQTISFAPLLLLFLVMALPVLVLDYRSRLGLTANRLHQVKLDLAPKRLGVMLLVVLGLGLSLFMLMPRFPGYQLRSFPVSAPIDFQGEFDQSSILNPGYVRGGLDDPNGTGEGAWGTVPGEVDDEFYYGFNSQINQNLRGEMTPRVVMRVRSQSPGFWRVLAFDRYTGQGWEISRNEEEEVQTLTRPRWTFRFTLPWNVTLNRTREVVQSYTVVSRLPNLIPALYDPKELYFPTSEIAIDPEGGLRSPVALSEGLTYTIVSEVPYRDRTLLRSAPTTLPPYISNHYLQVPEAIAPRLREYTESILAAAPNPITAASEQALYLTQYLKQNYRVQPNLPFFDEDEDLTEAFLFKYEGGYPDHFATTLTLMLRSIGIPARLVMGFAPGEFNPFTGYYVVRNTDAYAMTEVFFPKYGWFAFDPMPGHELIPPSIEESRVFGVLQQFWNWMAGWLPSPVTGVINRIWEWLSQTLGRAIGWFTALFTQGWAGILTGLAVLTGIGFLGWIGWSGWQQWRYTRWLAHLPPMEAIYQQMLRYLAVAGFPKAPQQTPLEYANGCQEQPSHRAKAIEVICRAYVEWRYGGQMPDMEEMRWQLREVKRRKREGGRGKAKEGR
ncbi:transglutaminase TgpA family protein [Egbenema bharatensis]|uniref:transglutaminase TgpA family protein n=1 Tax=Egbenema bharatensis TaxID=3463334 RepID=UPI003A86AE2C